MDEPYKSLSSILFDFLPVSIHCLLYRRAVYPETFFSTYRKFNRAVVVCHKQPVIDYINNCLDEVEKLVESDQIPFSSRILLLFYSGRRLHDVLTIDLEVFRQVVLAKRGVSRARVIDQLTQRRIEDCFGNLLVAIMNAASLERVPSTAEEKASWQFAVDCSPALVEKGLAKSPLFWAADVNPTCAVQQDDAVVSRKNRFIPVCDEVFDDNFAVSVRLTVF